MPHVPGTSSPIDSSRQSPRSSPSHHGTTTRRPCASAASIARVVASSEGMFTYHSTVVADR